MSNSDTPMDNTQIAAAAVDILNTVRGFDFMTATREDILALVADFHDGPIATEWWNAAQVLAEVIFEACNALGPP